MDNFDYKKYLSEGRLLNESAPGYDNRKFGESLPTMEGVKAAYEAKNDIKEDESEFERNTSGRIDQFTKELDALVDEYHAELYLNDDIFAGIEAVKMAAKDLVDPGNDDSYNSND
tara:strand:+ start:392 stop:736 length:345 start_codon:yes stop_codon:yes gene_type:complete